MAREPDIVIPADRLPPGFAQRIGEIAQHPAEPHPAATGVLMRDAADGIEILLMKRHRSSGFVPGAYVFAGGRVDAGDDDDALFAHEEPTEPPRAYWAAAIREIFEETGVLLARSEEGSVFDCAGAAGQLAVQRERLMTGETTLAEALRATGAVPDYSALAYAAHWITPLAEARRYDTRFFYAVMPPNATATADAREMSDAIWVSAQDALSRFRNGTLPMVFPTVRTIEGFRQYGTVSEAMNAARSSRVDAILPRLVRTGDGVGIVIDADNDETEKEAG